MKTLNIVFDDESSKVLDKFPNKSEAVRRAVKLYDEYATTDMIQIINGLKFIAKNQQEMRKKFDEMYERFEQMELKFNEIINR